ncbi:hypothetical protein [Ureibacillus thermosphaericus]|uniref:Uncharacterized protein n=1 Tax=Ureibacillus thermosphaericus TaxID=51173 RepID=A0A840PS44_URETH|nr:hypothetical protein [Ureibacillus thermosphaericus]MBB5149299.1 hypothetical protein [Ureibacillus thermosphaericus]NKZ32121.1 hypothetical protein [Ureibacillus thermosphaericus]
MKIDLGYIGAIAARNREKRLFETTNVMAGKQVEVIKNGTAYQITFSDEFKQVQGLMRMTTEEFFSKDINVKNADPSDLFSYRPQDQWLIFSQYLHEAKYFDSLSDENVKDIESILQHITDGIDSIAKYTGINLFGIKKQQLQSYEAQLELASSTAALEYFSNKFLSGDVKAGFDQLIQEYVQHNTKKVMEYQSEEERFYAARAKIKWINAPRTSEQSQLLSMTNKLGKTIYTHEEIQSVIKNYEELYKQIKDEESLASTLLEIKEQLLSFVIKGISPMDADYQLSREFVSQHSEETFKRIENYWKLLLQGEQA